MSKFVQMKNSKNESSWNLISSLSGNTEISKYNVLGTCYKEICDFSIFYFQARNLKKELNTMFEASMLHNRTNLNFNPIYNSKRNGNENELLIHILHETNLNGARTRNNEYLFPATSGNNVPFHCPHRRDEYRNRYILICESRWRQTMKK